MEQNIFLSNRYSGIWVTLAITRRGQSTGWFYIYYILYIYMTTGWFSFTLVADLNQTEDLFSSGFRQRPWWACCRRNTWFRSRRWSTTARSSWTSTTSWAKWRSFRREPFLHLSIKQQSVHISYRVQSDLDRRESLQRLTSTDIFRLELQNLFIAKNFKVWRFVHSYDFKGSINTKYH